MIQGTARSDWDRAVSHFSRYHPAAVEHWIVVLDPWLHARIAAALLPQLPSAELVSVDQLSPAAMQRLLDQAQAHVELGLLDFSGVDGGRPLRADEREVRNKLARWPLERIKRCFDVWDDNFAVLFADDPALVRQQCTALMGRLPDHPVLEYVDGLGTRPLSFRCDPDGWTAYTGFEEYDFILPSGEVSTLPRAVEGRLAVDGWIVGTLPFGMKYGRIHRGELALEFAAGEVTSVAGTNAELCADLETAFERLPGLGSVGELGIGQSTAVVRAAGMHERACLWHERHLGVHIGLGIELPEAADPERNTTAHHLDIVLARGALTAGEDVLVTW